MHEFVRCPVCDGYGTDKFGLACRNCRGLGQGSFAYGRFFYWGLQMGKAVIELDHLRRKFNAGLNALAYGVAVIGLASLGGWVYITTSHPDGFEGLAFWREQHVLILLFWIGIAAVMFVYYRLSEEERRRSRIRRLGYEEEKRPLRVADDWEDLKAAKDRHKIDVVHGLSPEAMAAVERAYTLAANLGQDKVAPIHLFFACLSDPQVAAIFSRLNADGDKLVEFIKRRIAKLPRRGGHTALSRRAKECLVSAYLMAYRLGQEKVSPKNLLVPALDRDRLLREALYDMEIDREKVMNVILWFIINERQVAAYRQYKQMARFKPSSNMDRAYTAVATPILNQLGYDLTAAAKWGRLDFCVARERDMDEIWRKFESGSSGVILTGPPGVGKRTVIDGIAQLMVKEQVPKAFQDKRLIELDAARLIAGADPAQAQGRLTAALDEAMRSGNIVLYLSNLENIVGITSGEEESLDLSEVLANALERRQIYCLASATSDNYAKYIERRSIGEAMARVEIAEPEGNQAIQIIESKIGFFEGKYRAYFSYNAIERAIELTRRYIHDKHLPDKAVKILEQVAVKASKERGENAVVTAEDIAEVVSRETKIPVTKIGANEGQELLHLEERIHQRMIDQSEAVKMVAAALRRARTQLREGKRPIASFLFLGPTGVGKTELAKAVSAVYFGDERYMARVDMSEYQNQDSVNKMIGSAEGAKGYLTEAVRRSPFTLVLLDEIEKAHPDILNLFLQVMDDGRLTDGQGNTIDFTNAIIIATSNIGAHFIQEEILKGRPHAEIKDGVVNQYLSKVMRPELINRFDGIVVFEPLSAEHVVEIARLMVGRIGKLLEGKGIGLRVEEPGLRLLAAKGFDPKFGARPLRRLLQDEVEDRIANYILAGELKRRDTVVVTDEAEVTVEKGVKILE